MKTKYLLVIAFITSNLSAQNGFSNFECLNSNPEAYEIFTAGGGEFSDEVNQVLNEFCDSLDNLTNQNIDENDPWNSNGVFIICNGEYIEIDTLNFDPVAFESYVLSLGCTEYQDWDFEDDSIYDDNYGFSNWDCLNYNPDAYEAYVSGGGIFTVELNQTLNEICSNWDGCVGCDIDESDPWNSDEVFFICNGEEIVIDTLDLINNPEEFYEYIESLNCAEAEDWFNEDNDTNTPDPGSYFSWDCIYNYPEAGALYLDYGNPEAGAQLEEFCLAVANGEWMWGEDPSEWPITCEEGSSFATVEFETSGIGDEEEISWSLDSYEGGIGLTPVCVNEGCTQFNMYDSWGDGWGGITFTLNTPNGVLLNGTLENGFVGALGFGINTTEDCSEVSEVENPFGYDLESFEDVFPSIGEINLDSLYPSIEFSENDLLFIIDGSEIDLSLFDENGLNIYPQEVNGYLIFGPFDINDLLNIDINDIADLLISWGFFRPMSDEIISQGTFSKDDPNLPSILSLNSESPNSVMDIILSSEDHTILATAISVAGLIETLDSIGPLTVFAPTNSAFEALPEGTLDALIANPTELTSILTHHVHIGAIVLSTDLYDGMLIPTMNGTNLEVSFPMNMVHIDNAMVTTADLTAANGVVHVIDAILLPSTEMSINESIILEENSKYLYSIDILGKKVDRDSRGMVIFDVYDSGKVLKQFKF